ncbi:uncharacterized protein I303_107233 [Kwoniella dejecticola CBS 10117]|uniref:Transcription activator of gluconeogenesis ERT1 n=1 Tax=Kwoniella dejecticola CBS 10117 TaxID=1296121 RepID=A0A1A5ZZ58_9TREE|nr:uncharacterized protein I303_06634 [Kwoniella dejecticola CBS 10117]OBR83075.1 hypothetical protein I303_06634 [Kwoniella dejecticola CBS 10117]
MDHRQTSGYDQPSSSSSRQPLFDGPGSRPILESSDFGIAGPGPASAASASASASATSALTASNLSQNPLKRKSPSPMSEPRGTASPGQETSMIKRVGGKANVSSACGPCKRAHLACDVARPCKRCVNMGKEDQCEDVPHKKRGRPKVPKPALGEPYHRARPPPTDNGGVGRWKGPSMYDAPYMSTVDAPPPPLGSVGGGRNSPPIPRPLGVEGDPTYPVPQSNMPFTLFTTTDFKILRASPSTYHLIGYHPNEFVNLNLLEWIHPQDRHFIDQERNRLITVPYVDGPLRSTEVNQAAITQRTEIELLSPAEGMREPYPNKNVRVLHSDNRFSPFNVRLHLGGGLGASLWQPNTIGRVYLVVSFLPIPPPRDLPREGASTAQPARRTSGIAPPTPITPVPPMASGQGLPGFSSIAAAADAPQTRYDQPPPPQAYYPPLPQQQHSSSRPPTASQNAYPYPRAGPMAIPPPGASGIPSAYPRRSTSPNSSYRTPQTSTYPINTAEYPQQQQQAPLPPPPSGYYPPHPPPDQSFRRPSDEEQWRAASMGSNGNGNGNGNGNSMSMRGGQGIPPMQPGPGGQQLPPPPGQGGMPNDGSRRAWEL